jgi:hypothetical protein
VQPPPRFGSAAGHVGSAFGAWQCQVVCPAHIDTGPSLQLVQRQLSPSYAQNAPSGVHVWPAAAARVGGQVAAGGAGHFGSCADQTPPEQVAVGRQVSPRGSSPYSQVSPAVEHPAPLAGSAGGQGVGSAAPSEPPSPVGGSALFMQPARTIDARSQPWFAMLHLGAGCRPTASGRERQASPNFVRHSSTHASSAIARPGGEGPSLSSS